MFIFDCTKIIGYEEYKSYLTSIKNDFDARKANLFEIHQIWEGGADCFPENYIDFRNQYRDLRQEVINSVLRRFRHFLPKKCLIYEFGSLTKHTDRIESDTDLTICYTDQANDKRYTFHVEFVCKCRGAISHSKNENTCNYVYRKLKNYYFYDDSSFKYVDWFDFWYEATEKHWEKLVKKIVKDSDRFYNDYMLLIANHATSLKNVYEKISEVFKIGTYSISDSQINIYEKSLDYRFMKNLCNKVEDSTTWRDESIAKEELKTFYTQGLLSDEEIKKLKEVGKSTPQELKKKLIDKLKVFLVSEHCQDSVIIFKYLHQIIVELIEDQVNAEIISEYKDMLE